MDDLDATLLNCFGFESFRSGQREGIERILRGASSIVIIPTGALQSERSPSFMTHNAHLGSGKSLCYQLPAYLLKKSGIALVVCPLISLMQDQLNTMPSCLSAATLHSSQSVRAGCN